MPDYQFDFIFQPLEADHSNLVKIGQCPSSLRHLRVARQFVNLCLLLPPRPQFICQANSESILL